MNKTAFKAHEPEDFIFWKEHYKQQKERTTPKKMNEDNNKFWYLCTPYSKFPGGLEEAYKMAAEMLMFLERSGHFVFCPIVHSHTAAKYAPDLWSHDFWLPVDFKFVKISRGLIVDKMLGWEDSYGITEEIKYANMLELPILYTNHMEMPEELQSVRK